MRKSSITLLGAAILAISARSSVAAEQLPQAVPEEQVAPCKYISIVEGVQSSAKINGWQELAKNIALKQAKKINASHVVWDQMISLDKYKGIAVGKAYQCKSE